MESTNWDEIRIKLNRKKDKAILGYIYGKVIINITVPVIVATKGKKYIRVTYDLLKGGA